MNKRLYRSETDRIVGGVCGGLGEYLGIPAIILRIFFIVWMILGEFALLVYVALWLIVPRQGNDTTFRAEDLGIRIHQMFHELGEVFHQPDAQLITYAGIGLIGWGAYVLLARLGIHLLPVGYGQYIWPVLLIIAGAFVLVKTLQKRK